VTAQTWCPFAIHKPLAEATQQPKIVPICVILHSAGGSAELEGWWNNPLSKGLESHFFVDDATFWENGVEYAKLYQYMPIDVRADANGEANRFLKGSRFCGAVSVETASTVHASEPWSGPQLRTLNRLGVWLVAQTEIEPKIMRTKIDNGFGWHVMFGAPGPWTDARGKVCPGPARIKQVPGLVETIKALSSGAKPYVKENILAAITEERFKDLEDKVDAILRQLENSADRSSPKGATVRNGLIQLGAKL
jgi:hypothetical protein